MIDKQFTLYLENKPGVLADLTGKLAKAKVNIQGISVAESTDGAIVQIVSDKEAATANVLRKAKIPFTVQSVALVMLKNKPGALARLVSEISKAKVNINYIYTTACVNENGGGCYAVIGAPDLKKVEQAWKRVHQ